MARALTAGMVTEVTGVILEPIILVQFVLDSGNLNLWTGVGSLTFNAETYVGGGDLVSMSQMEETEGVIAKGMTFTLTGIDTAILSLALNQPYQGRTVNVWFAAFDSSKAIVSSPYKFFVGRLDTMVIEEGAVSSTIGVSAENILVGLEKANERRYTPEDQRLSVAKLGLTVDKGFDFVVELQNKEILFGSAG